MDPENNKPRVFTEEGFRALIENSLDGVALVDPGGSVIYASPSTARVLGYTVEEIGSLNGFSLLHPDDVPRAMKTLALVLEAPGATASLESRVRHKDATWRWVDAVGANLLDDPHVQAIVVNFRDITDRKRAEEERADLLAREQAARAQAEAAVRAREELLSIVSHDLKNKLVAILGASKLLIRQVSESGSSEMKRLSDGLARIEDTATKMTMLVNEMLDFARLQAGGELDLFKRPVDVVALARQVAAERQHFTDRHELRVEAAEAQLVGVWDGFRLERVLTNLISNAVKYSPSGGEVVISVATGAAPQQDELTGSWAEISVRDEGVGIAATDLPYIFERFWRSGNVATRIGGTGIGLAIARRIIEQHGGTIGVTSQVGIGSNFIVRLPLAEL
jgi:PAS domain S-box-containing protein